MFSSIKHHITRAYQTVTDPLKRLFGAAQFEQALLDELAAILLAADVGPTTVHTIVKRLHEHVGASGADARQVLRDVLVGQLDQVHFAGMREVVMLVGVNGSGKTTALAKLAHMQKQAGKKVLVCAADTFRAAAVEQLNQWTDRIGCAIVTGQPGADPSSLVYRACQQFVAEGYDSLLIDTAGRLQTKTNLMNELAKMRRVVDKLIGADRTTTLITLDAMLGQNSFEQAKIFNECCHLDGAIVTKFDGTGKAGVVVALASQLALPVAFVTYGESLESIIPFKAHDYVDHILGS